jgi:AcrR family transcriptional regulator
MSQPTIQRMDRRRARTRAALLRAGQALFAARSPEAVTIDDIVDAAEVAKGSFYNHFPDKDALAAELAREARRHVEALAERFSSGVDDPAERVARAVCGFARHAADDPMGVRLNLRLFQGSAIPDAPMNAGVRADIRAGLSAGRFSGLSLEAALIMTVGSVQMVVGRILEQNLPALALSLSRDVAAGLLRGLGVEPAAAKAIAARAAADIFADAPRAG